MSDDALMYTSKVVGERITQYLAEGKRFDGRTPEEFRDITISYDVSKKAEGSARVKMGNTEVIAGVKMAISTPYPDSPDEGSMMVTAEMLPLSSPRVELGPPKFPTIELGRVIDRGIRESKCIDFKKLCVVSGEKVWTVFIDLYVLNDDGNLFDAAGLAAIAALNKAVIPTYDVETDKIDYGTPSGNKLPVADRLPMAITAYKIGESFVVDPTKEEEDVADTRITIGVSDGIISSAQKGDLAPVSAEALGEVFDLVAKVERELYKTLSPQLK